MVATNDGLKQGDVGIRNRTFFIQPTLTEIVLPDEAIQLILKHGSQSKMDVAALCVHKIIVYVILPILILFISFRLSSGIFMLSCGSCLLDGIWMFYTSSWGNITHDCHILYHVKRQMHFDTFQVITPSQPFYHLAQRKPSTRIEMGILIIYSGHLHPEGPNKYPGQPAVFFFKPRKRGQVS